MPAEQPVEVGAMGLTDKLVLNRQRHLKWRAFDKLELVLMILCGVTLFGLAVSVTADISDPGGWILHG